MKEWIDYFFRVLATVGTLLLVVLGFKVLGEGGGEEFLTSVIVGLVAAVAVHREFPALLERWRQGPF